MCGCRRLKETGEMLELLNCVLNYSRYFTGFLLDVTGCGGDLNIFEGNGKLEGKLIDISKSLLKFAYKTWEFLKNLN